MLLQISDRFEIWPTSQARALAQIPKTSNEQWKCKTNVRGRWGRRWSQKKQKTHHTVVHNLFLFFFPAFYSLQISANTITSPWTNFRIISTVKEDSSPKKVLFTWRQVTSVLTRAEHVYFHQHSGMLAPLAWSSSSFLGICHEFS